MTCLHVSIQSSDGERFMVACDNTRREDATKKEILMANAIEKILNEAIKAVADEVISHSFTQKGAE